MAEQSTKKTRNFTIPLLIAVVAALIAIIMMVNSGVGKPPKAPNPQAQQSQSEGDGSLAKLARREPNDPLALGKTDAPVVMIMYSEFQCPYCGKFARETAPTLMDKYVDNGTLRIEWRDFPYLGKESTNAAKAARAAAQQDKFWEFHDELYANAQPVNGGKVTEEFLADIAQRLKLDVKKFRQDMNSDKIATAVQKDFDEGQQIGVNGTPAFLINGNPLIGAQPVKEFEAAIEAAKPQ